jgi:uncharacterized protein
MLIVISPAKNVDFKPQNILKEYTLPQFTEKSEILVNELRKFSASDLAELFTVNRKIADLNFERYVKWHLPFTPENAKQAILAFNGEVYNGLKAKTLPISDLKYAQNHLRMLSGLYGVLRPFDLIQPYRLEMGIKLPTPNKKDLYQFWADTITSTINLALKDSGGEQILVNLASNEYVSSINRKKLEGKVLSIEFKEEKHDHYKTIVVYTKKARGMMSRFIIQNRIENAEDIKGFDNEGYMFNPRLSKEWNWVFTR